MTKQHDQSEPQETEQSTPHEHIDGEHHHQHLSEMHEHDESPAGTSEPEKHADTTDAEERQPATHEPKKTFKQFLATKKGKILMVVAGVVVLIGLVFAIPTSRYAVAGLVLKKDVALQVVDSKTGKPVSGVQLVMNGQTVKTDANGKATVQHVPVGPWPIKATKNYYQDTSSSTLVPILSNPGTTQIKMVATGRQVPITLINTISGQPVSGVEVTAGASSASTASDGTAVIILPADKATVSATFKTSGYNTATSDITVTEQADAKNTFNVTPTGKIYFLSRRTGTLNVMKSDLDGQNQTVAVTGTGKEDQTQTTLLASRDWQYLALQAKRDSTKPKLYLLTTASDKLTVIDEGENVIFTPVGWSDHNFVYTVSRTDVQAWQPKAQSIKSFNATTGKIVTLDDTDGTGSNANTSAHENYTTIYIINDQIIFGKNWNSYYILANQLNGKKNAIYSVKANGDNKKTLKDFDVATVNYLEAIIYRPDEVYFRANSSPARYYVYDNGAVNETTDVNDSNYYNQTYSTYLVSPSGNNTFWYEQRDGINVAFVGDKSGENGKQVLADDAFQPYGWYSDDYLLFSKNGSELYVLPVNNAKNVKPLKITDYHKPSVTFPGYGYGYGGGS